MRNHRIQFVTSHDRLTQLLRLRHDDPFGGNQRNLVRHTDDQLLLIERLGDKVITSHLESLHYIRRAIQRSQENDRNIRHFGISFHLLRHVKPTDVRHHDIQQHKIRFLFLHLRQSLRTVAGGYNLKFLIVQ